MQTKIYQLKAKIIRMKEIKLLVLSLGILIIFYGNISASESNCRDIYISSNASDSNIGSIEKPFASLERAKRK